MQGASAAPGHKAGGAAAAGAKANGPLSMLVGAVVLQYNAGRLNNCRISVCFCRPAWLISSNARKLAAVLAPSTLFASVQGS